MPPFLMLYDNDYEKRKCLLLHWMNGSLADKIGDGMQCKVIWIYNNIICLNFVESCEVYDTSSILSSSDEIRSMSAVFPAVFLLKHLLLKPLLDVHVLASHLLKYTQRLPCINIRELKPLIDLASQKVKRYYCYT